MSSLNKSYFTISIFTKPYLKKYLETRYGSPITFTTDNYFGMSVVSLLERPLHIHKKKEFIRLRTDRFEDKLIIHCPISFLSKYRYGVDITDEKTISLNKLFEEKFEEELTFFCQILSICGVEIKDALEEFCKNFNIDIGTDISYDALKKKEYRFRQKQTFSPPQVSPKNKTIIQQTLMFGE